MIGALLSPCAATPRIRRLDRRLSPGQLPRTPLSPASQKNRRSYAPTAVTAPPSAAAAASRVDASALSMLMKAGKADIEAGFNNFNKISEDHATKVKLQPKSYGEEQPAWTTSEISDQAGLRTLASQLNPAVGFWDPLGLSTDATPEFIGFLRHAEIKHGRIAMAGFIGYCVQANGIHFPWAIQNDFIGKGLDTVTFGDIAAAGGPADQWDALSTPAKLQILGVIGFLEMWGETSASIEMDGEKHYCRGGTPGYYPKLQNKFPHPVPLDLWDPFGFTSKMSSERKSAALLAEVNNGRLAMIGLMGLISTSKGLIVPGMDILPIAPYRGEIMAPFSAVNGDLPMVNAMLNLLDPAIFVK